MQCQPVWVRRGHLIPMQLKQFSHCIWLFRYLPGAVECMPKHHIDTLLWLPRYQQTLQTNLWASLEAILCYTVSSRPPGGTWWDPVWKTKLRIERKITNLTQVKCHLLKCHFWGCERPQQTKGPSDSPGSLSLLSETLLRKERTGSRELHTHSRWASFIYLRVHLFICSLFIYWWWGTPWPTCANQPSQWT